MPTEDVSPSRKEFIQDDINATFNVIPKTKLPLDTSDDEMEFPIFEDEHYDIVEKSLGSQRNANALVIMCVNLKDIETEEKYLDRIFLKLF